MGNIIPLPNRAALALQNPRPQNSRDNSDELHSAQILIFPGVRYSHHADEGDTPKPQLSKR